MEQEKGKRTATKTRGVFKRITQNGDVVFDIRYKINGRSIFEKIGAYSEGIREAYAARIRLERVLMARRGELPPTIARGHRLFGELLDDYLAIDRYKHYKSSAKKLTGLLNKPANSINEKDIETIIKTMKQDGLADATINAVLEIVAGAFRVAKMKNPVAHIKK
jgi:hypothetical protein